MLGVVGGSLEDGQQHHQRLLRCRQVWSEAWVVWMDVGDKTRIAVTSSEKMELV